MQRTVDYRNNKVLMIDQTLIPDELVVLELETCEAVADAITTMKVRGAPAIGVTAALGVALAAGSCSAQDPGTLLDALGRASRMLRGTRPTAVNLFWGIDRMMDAARTGMESGLSAGEIKNALSELASSMLDEDEEV